MVDFSPLVSYIVIQLYVYIATRHIFGRINLRRKRRYQKLRREATEIENFGSLLLSFLIGGAIYIPVSQYIPVAASSIGPSVWLGYALLLVLGFLLASRWGMLRNPYE